MWGCSPFHGNYPLDVGSQRRYDPRRKRGCPVTVCVAAICTHYAGEGFSFPVVVGASDRKYTAGDWTYEPNQTKRFAFLGPFENRASAIVAGVAAENLAICTEAQKRALEAGETSIQQLAATFAGAFADYRRAEAERKLLYPLGLTLQTYSQEAYERVESLSAELRRWELEDAALIVGADDDGTVHLYEIDDPGWQECHDAIAFAAIGSGRNHAAAEFMRVQFDRSFSVARTLLLAYRAKKAAEVDPFVGKATDMFVLVPGGANPPSLHDDLYAEVERAHRRLERQEQKTRANADERIEKSVERHLRKQAEAAIEQEGVRRDDEQKRLSSGSEEGEPSEA